MFSLKKNEYGLLIFTIFLTMSYVHPHHIHPYRTYYHDILTVFALFIISSYLAIFQSPRLITPQVVIIPVFGIGAIFLQMFFDIVLIQSDLLLPSLYFLFFGLALVVGASYAYPESGAESICCALAIAHLLAALLSVIMQVIQAIGFDASPLIMYIAPSAQPFMRPYANVAQPNQLALLFCFGLASIWWLYQRFLIRKAFVVSLVIAMLWGLALTQSRIGWLIVPVFILISIFRIEKGRTVSRWLIVALGILYVGFVVSLPVLGELIGFASGSVADHVGGRSERLVLMQQAWHMALQHPWLGVGWFGFGAEQVNIAADFGSSTYAEHSHNLILNFLAELGFPATIVIFSVLGWWFLRACILPRATVNSRFANLFFVAVFIHSMVEFPLWYAFVLIPVGILMGMMHQLRWPSEGVRVNPWVIVSIFMVACLALILITFDYQRVTAGFRALRWEQSGYVIQKQVLEKPTFTLFPQFFDYFKFSKLVAREGMSGEEIAFAERMSHRFGYVHVLSKMAEIYVLNGQPEKAKRMMLTLQRLHPIVYPEYFDYWKVQASLDDRYAAVFKTMPPRDAP
ncbi:Wzy polymerase domain-containing protein [Undibacterium sp. Rencai35W]|uniref:PglL family O-oligosaccharyltransferase n=1 Tax=Undibacterium sp. Rencai35W TaxID=3413046 RepID=UPI003BF308D9